MSPSMIATEAFIPDAILQDLDDLLPEERWFEEGTCGETIRLLNPVPPGPWRSLGRCLDYTNWADRERFIELDRAIQIAAQLEAAAEYA